MVRVGVLACLVMGLVSGSMTWEEAHCVLDGQKVTFVGDSLSRYCYFGLNTFLATGELRSEDFSSPGGYGPGSSDYDSVEFWNERGILTDRGSQRMHAWKEFEREGGLSLIHI